MNATHTLFDAPGPRTRRRILIGSILGGLVAIVGAVFIYLKLAANGQMDADKWLPFITQPELQLFLLSGLLNTAKVAIVSLGLAMTLGIALALCRMSPLAWVYWPATVVLEIARGAPVLLSILFLFLAFPKVFGIDLPAFWTIVLALTLYNGAVIAEIVRAGVQSLPRGQNEAAIAIGLTWWQSMRMILLPQALRVMLPSLISQLVVLIKDSALGFIVGYQELTMQGQSASLILNNPLQTYFVIGMVYVAINSALSATGNHISAHRGARRTQPAPASQ